jgi:hypothetical protein
MMASEVDKALAKIRAICERFPEFHEVEAWGHPTFRAGKKMFAAFGDAYGVVALGLRVGHDRQAELLGDKRFFLTPYAGHLGWVSLKIDAKTKWAEVERLLLEAYRGVALKRMLKTLDDG